MIEEIVKLKNKGLTMQEIAEKMNTTLGKIQYRWMKYRKENGEQYASLTNEVKSSVKWKMPDVYETDVLFSMVHSPSALFVYWHVTKDLTQMAEHHFRASWPFLQKALKVYDVTDIIFYGHNAHRSFEIKVPEMTNNWFIRDLEPNRSYVVDFGTRTYDGQFFTLLRSNTVETSRTEAQGIDHGKLSRWCSHESKQPEWIENFSSYSYYQKIR